MRIFCKMGMHRFSPTKVFESWYMDEGRKIWVVSITGYQCGCGKRKINKDTWKGQSPYATQQAYDWLNYRPAQAQVLKMVKR